jgi:hypothetical protein
MWLYGDLSFLPTPTTNPLPTPHTPTKTKPKPQTKKPLEDTWGQTTLKLRRPDLKLDKQWTNKFGEHICEEILLLYNHTVSKPKNINHFQPDLQTETTIWEAKTGTYFTPGTAGEKILGSPFKYADIPTLYEKPLKILCMGGAEQLCRNQYGNLPGSKCTPQKQKFLDFFKDNQIEFVAASDMLTNLLIATKPPIPLEAEE